MPEDKQVQTVGVVAPGCVHEAAVEVGFLVKGHHPDKVAAFIVIREEALHIFCAHLFAQSTSVQGNRYRHSPVEVGDGRGEYRREGEAGDLLHLRQVFVGQAQGVVSWKAFQLVVFILISGYHLFPGTAETGQGLAGERIVGRDDPLLHQRVYRYIETGGVAAGVGDSGRGFDPLAVFAAQLRNPVRPVRIRAESCAGVDDSDTAVRGEFCGLSGGGVRQAEEDNVRLPKQVFFLLRIFSFLRIDGQYFQIIAYFQPFGYFQSGCPGLSVDKNFRFHGRLLKTHSSKGTEKNSRRAGSFRAKGLQFPGIGYNADGLGSGRLSCLRRVLLADFAQTEYRYRLLVENIKELVFELDEKGNFLYMSPNWGDYFGISPADSIGTSFVPFVHPDDVPVCMELFQRVVTTGERGESGEYRVKTADGNWRWQQASGAPVFDRDGRIISYVGVARDVTEQKTVRESLEVRTKAMEASIDGIAILDDKQRYVYVNQSHADVYGYGSAEELLGKSWRILYSDDELSRFENEIMPEFMKQGYWRGEATGLKKDGSTFPQAVSLTALSDGGLICVVRDITPLVVTRMSLQNALGEKEVMLREFQHRVKNSFHMVMNMIELRRDMQESPAADAALLEVEKRVKALADLYAMLYTADSFENVDLGEYCRTVGESLLDLSSGVRYEGEYISFAVPLNFAATIGLILIELLTNSLKYAFPAGGGVVSVCLSADNSLIRLVVSDDGIGLPEKTSTKGIGLVLVRGMVRQLRGDLVCENENGARFRMSFPAP